MKYAVFVQHFASTTPIKSRGCGNSLQRIIPFPWYNFTGAQVVKELDSYDATGYKEKSRFYLVITAMGVMWQNASADICVGENVKFLDWKISPVKDPEKRVAVITVFAEKIKDLLSETYKDSEIVVSFRNCEFYQVNSRMGNFKTLRIWELENDIAFIDQYKSAKVAGFPLPQKPPLFSGAEITIRPKVKKQLKEL